MAESSKTAEDQELAKLVEEAAEQPGVADLFAVDKQLAEMASIEEDAAMASEPESVTGADFVLAGDQA